MTARAGDTGVADNIVVKSTPVVHQIDEQSHDRHDLTKICFTAAPERTPTNGAGDVARVERA